MLFNRQIHLLAFLRGLGGRVGALDFQKLLFLFSQEEATPTYEFVPYRFGAFSFTSYADKRRLLKLGMLADEEQLWVLTPAGSEASRRALPEHSATIDRFARRHQGLLGDALVAEAYRRHPYYAIRSEIADRILAADGATRAAIAEQVPSARGPGLFTIGYQGRSLEAYLNTLLRQGVDILCDVRRNPLSRKCGFSKGILSRSCEGVGLRYMHMPELGIPSSERQGLHTQADYDALLEIYEQDYLPKQSAIVGGIRDLVCGGHRVALTCFERLPCQCHRERVAQAICRASAAPLGVEHF